eukprot:4157960-Pleurochrysis_carterae.AAC.2
METEHCTHDPTEDGTAKCPKTESCTQRKRVDTETRADATEKELLEDPSVERTRTYGRARE